jgi:hypothetical protein
VVRGWIDGADLKVRLLASGDVEGEAVCSTAASASAQLAAWLSSLDDRTVDQRPGDGSEMFG